MSILHTIGNIIAILLACMWTFASQAHFTSKYTPDFANEIDASTKAIHPAFAFSGVSEEQLKQLFGFLAVATASMLWLPQTRRLGCRAAAFVTFVGRVYPMLTVKGMETGNMEVVAGSAAAATIAAILLAS